MDRRRRLGAVAARRVKMTAMPQMVALFNGIGGVRRRWSSLAEYHRLAPRRATPERDIWRRDRALGADRLDLVRGLIVAFGKLQELIHGRPITYPGQHVVNGAAPRSARSPPGSTLVAGVQDQWLLWALVAASLLFGVLFVLPIGGADMPVVISLLNAFTGLAAAATGFELENNVLIVSGMLVGASGTLLTLLMGRAMNRSIANVLFGAFGQVSPEAAAVAGDGRRHGPLRHRRGRRRDARLRAQGRDRPRLRARGRAGAARRAPARRPARGQGRRGHVRDPPGRRAGCRGT